MWWYYFNCANIHYVSEFLANQVFFWNYASNFRRKSLKFNIVTCWIIIFWTNRRINKQIVAILTESCHKPVYRFICNTCKKFIYGWNLWQKGNLMVILLLIYPKQTGAKFHCYDWVNETINMLLIHNFCREKCGNSLVFWRCQFLNSTQWNIP